MVTVSPNKIIRIAIADDVPILRKGLILLLNSYKPCGVDIEANNGQELINKIKLAENKPDICILDISMPVMDGYETLSAIKQYWPNIKVVILSVHYNEYTIIRTVREGASCCLPKEVDTDELFTAIKQVHNKGYYHTELVKHYLTNSMYEDVRKLKLNKNEQEFLRLCCSDMSYKQIAMQMELSPRTIDGYRDDLFLKLNIKSRSALVMFALQTGLVTSPSEKA